MIDTSMIRRCEEIIRSDSAFNYDFFLIRRVQKA